MSSSLRQRKPAGGQEPAVQQSEAAPKKPGCPVNLNKGEQHYARRVVHRLVRRCILVGRGVTLVIKETCFFLIAVYRELEGLSWSYLVSEEKTRSS